MINIGGDPGGGGGGGDGGGRPPLEFFWGGCQPLILKLEKYLFLKLQFKHNESNTKRLI